MARSLAVAVILLVVAAAAAPFANAGPEAYLSTPGGVATGVAQAAGGGLTPGLPLYQETGNPVKDALPVAGASAATGGGLVPGLPLWQETGNPAKDLANRAGASAARGAITPGLPLYQGTPGWRLSLSMRTSDVSEDICGVRFDDSVGAALSLLTLITWPSMDDEFVSALAAPPGSANRGSAPAPAPSPL